MAAGRWQVCGKEGVLLSLHLPCISDSDVPGMGTVKRLRPYAVGAGQTKAFRQGPFVHGCEKNISMLSDIQCLPEAVGMK